jgi:hypothetical protein
MACSERSEMINTEYIACMASELEVRTEEGQISHDASLPNHGTYMYLNLVAF